jgi:tetratricopeptide (TPR) repeat protein
MRQALLLSLLLLPGVAVAAPTKPVAAPKPAEPVRPPSMEQLFAQLKKAQSAEEAHPIEEKLAGMFRASGSPSVDLLMTRAQAATAADDKATARKLVEAVTAIAPAYAEGWRTRAEMENAAGDDTAALVSLQRAVLLNPRHFQALDQLGGMLEEYGDKSGALKLYRRALALDPQMDGANRHVKSLTQSVEGRDI